MDRIQKLSNPKLTYVCR